MMKIRKLITVTFPAIMTVGVLSICSAAPSVGSVTDKVDVFIGTGAHCHNFPSAMAPFGAVVAGPDCATVGWDAAAGYHYDAKTIIGFSQQHLSGTGLTELGDIMIMPTVGKLNFNPGTDKNPDAGYRSRYSHDNESARPGYYQVMLSDYGINVEITATERVGFYKFTLPKADSSRVLLDLVHHINGSGSRVGHAYYKVVNPQTITGYRLTNAVWAPNRQTYFAIEFSKPFVTNITEDGVTKKVVSDLVEKGSQKLKVAFDFGGTEGEVIMVKVAISSVSMENAYKNLKSEVAHWDFDRVKRETDAKWCAELGDVEAAGDQANVNKFYAALYHNMIHPSIATDVNGEYRGISKEPTVADGYTQYHMFSLWDTFRATHPLFTIIHQQRTGDIMRSMLAFQRQNPAKMLPMWSMFQDENSCMIGLHSLPVIADAHSKGLVEDNLSKELLQAMITSSNETGVADTSKDRVYPSYYNQQVYLEKGYHPYDLVRSGASVTLEHTHNDWTVAFMANQLGEKSVVDEYLKRAQNYRNIWDNKSKFFRAKSSDGVFREPFEARSYHREDFHDRDYVEGNAWQYLFALPHDVYGLSELMGGRKAFKARLDEMFNLPYQGESTIGDVSGLIGDYAHGNEPCHHVAYLYSYVGAATSTQERIHEVNRRFYKDAPDGYIGNEDAGQMSAWYVFSAMGFYPVNPVGGIYVVGSPLLESVKIKLESGKTFEMKAHNLSDENIYIQSMKINGMNYDNVWFDHDVIAEGGLIEFFMGSKPSKWGSKSKDVPYADGGVERK